MSEMPPVGKAAGHVLLDAAAAWDDDANTGINEAAVTTALEALGAMGAVRFILDADDQATVDAPKVVFPALYSSTTCRTGSRSRPTAGHNSTR